MEFEFEPIFASAALYDAKEKKKVTFLKIVGYFSFFFLRKFSF